MKKVLWVCLLVFGSILNWSMTYAANVYVESSGLCGGETPCYSTIQAAINAANSGDTIKLAQGIYAETFVLDSGKQLILQGGWDVGFTNQTPRTTAIRAPIITMGAIAFQELRIMQIAGPMGNASIADVLDGKTFSCDTGTGLIGIMVNREGLSYTPKTTDQTIAAGYYNGSGKVAGDLDLTSSNIISGVNIFGVAGSAVAATGDAVEADVLTGKTFSKAGSANLNGTMSNNGPGSTRTPGTSNQTLAAGYWSSANTVLGDGDLAAGNIKDGVTIFGVTGTFPSDGTAVAGDVKTGSTFYTTSDTKLIGNGTKELSAASNTVAAGYYAETTLSGVDEDLTGGNIVLGKSIFGVAGTYSPAFAPRVNKTGQTVSYGPGDDGEYEKGIDPAIAPTGGGTTTGAYNTPAWTGVRFTDNDDGTVTDNLTGLIWLKNANCFGGKDWVSALSDCNSLADSDCDLTDGSNAGAWRLPNVNELHSLIDLGQLNPALPSGHPFTGVQLNDYWSSTTNAGNTPWAYVVLLFNGNVDCSPKTYTNYVWPVRAGQ